jgi:hypothetical protein
MLAVACVAPSIASAQSVAGKPPGATRPTAYNLPLQHQSIALYAITPRISSPLAPLVNFQNAEIKFNLQTLMNTLRDNRHEGWVLAGISRSKDDSAAHRRRLQSGPGGKGTPAAGPAEYDAVP